MNTQSATVPPRTGDPSPDTPVVTVVMPAHNASRTLRQAIESILGQTFTAFELIVVDDGSTDRTGEIAASYRDARIRCLVQRNEGYPSAMNNGIAMARGRYVARMDADDIADRERLEQQVDFLESRREYGVVGTLYDLLTPNGKRWRHATAPVDTPWSDVAWEDIMSGHRTFADASVMFRTEAGRQAGGYRTYQRSGQDVDLWLRLIEHGFRFAVVNRVLYFLRFSLGALTGRRLTGAYNKIPRVLATERQKTGSDRVMRGEPLDGLMTQEMIDRAEFWHVRDLWYKSRVCFLAGDGTAGVRFLLHAATEGGVTRTNVGQCWEFVRAVRHRKREPGEGAHA